ncbi:hypothetical protein [Cellulomonas shaoxiangyii]|uniref:Uncharacterized protein n=1 Tax=Cellulomonas shaoxiangyii TaxID=2566013 RepID=A0A4P7SL60_9CELL|nr:hypothetical protein [Cellulomonas shaoxiangyii]QCB93293.1 hypothetical protein E5225_06760 [Cellulomonas shaoxiangyii]TGY82488.1 hypothetical protein E5226_13190 [Cellulomonas shaoxiangyii]
MPHPGTLANLVPPGEAGQLRRMEDIERTQREMLPAVMKAVGPLIEELQAAQEALAAQQAELVEQTANLAARVTVTASTPTFNTGPIPNDGAWHEYGPDIALTVEVPTGRLVVTVGCGEASMNAGGAAVNAEATFAIAGVAAYGDFSSRSYLTSPDAGVGTPLMTQQAFTVTPGTYTVIGKMRAWGASTVGASVNFRRPYVTVQVTG